MNSSQKMISVIIPVYNVEKYLSKCLDSIINQTYENLEIICVNDGSEDSCKRILEEYSEKDKRFIIVNQKNQGLSEARNTGLKNVHGQYIMFVDSDDWIDEHTCESVIAAAEKYNADTVLWAYSREYGEYSKHKYMDWENEKNFDKNEVCSKIHRRLCGLVKDELKRPDYANAIETAWGKLYSSNIILSNQLTFVDTKIIGTEDALFNLYAFGYANKAVYLRKAFYHYRKTNSISLTATYKKDLFHQWQNLFERMNQYISDNNLSYEYKEGLQNRIALSVLGLGLNIVGSDMPAKKKIKKLKEIVSDSKYQVAYRDLEFKYFSLHWKLFYFCAKQRLSVALYLLLKVMRKIRRKKFF